MILRGRAKGERVGKGVREGERRRLVGKVGNSGFLVANGANVERKKKRRRNIEATCAKHRAQTNFSPV